YDYFTGTKYIGAQNITWSNANQTQTPLFVREGAIIPMISTNVQSLCNATYVANSNIVTADNSLQFLVYPSTNSNFAVYDGTTLQCQTNGSVVTLSLSSTARSLMLRVFGPEPFSVERDGITLSKFTNAADFAQATLGWTYQSPFLLVKFSHS